MLARAGRGALIGTIAVAAACGGDTGTGPTTGNPNPVPTSAAGSYTVTTVNGKALPVALASDTSGLYKYEITTGALSLTADGKYSVVTTYRQTIPSNVSTFVDSTGGTWVQSGTAIVFTNAQDGSKDNAVWANTGQLTFVETDGSTTTTYVYLLKK